MKNQTILLEQRCFNFGKLLGNSKIIDEDTIYSDQEKPYKIQKLFIVGKKPKTNIVNQKSCVSKQTILLSHGDQYREIYQFTEKINESLMHKNQPDQSMKQISDDVKNKSINNFKELTKSSNQSPCLERIYNNGLSLHLSPKNVQKFENFKPKDKDQSEIENLNVQP